MSRDTDKINKIAAENKQLRDENIRLRLEKANLLLSLEKNNSHERNKQDAKDRKIEVLNQQIKVLNQQKQWTLLFVQHLVNVLLSSRILQRSLREILIKRGNLILKQLTPTSTSSISEAEQYLKLNNYRLHNYELERELKQRSH